MDINKTSHRRYNILADEWVLVSPHRAQRPWQGKEEKIFQTKRSSYDEKCYLCPKNERAGGVINPDYKDVFIFQNDFAAILKDDAQPFEKGLLRAEIETGVCKVICFSPNHSLTLSLMPVKDICKIVRLWQKQYKVLGDKEDINYVQIFENKGEIMGCSNLHPHGQIWAQKSIPNQIIKKTTQQKKYWNAHKTSLLTDYLKQELEQKDRILIENEYFVGLVPYWAIWPYETMILPKKHHQNIGQLHTKEVECFAEMIKQITTIYDNLFEISFPYSSGIHQAPTDKNNNDAWHFHMSFYPPLLRSATVKKFMVGYEMFATPQRDITPEQAANTLRNLPTKHFLE